jgi:hypothetical protein
MEVMWPKVFAQLVELLPHVSRLIPMADKFFASKTASEKANEAALAAMAEGVRGDLGQVTAAHAGLYRQLQDQSAQLAEAVAEARRTRMLLEEDASKIIRLEKEVASLAVWVKMGFGLLVVVLALLVALFLRTR